jgi:hypothetical protein
MRAFDPEQELERVARELLAAEYRAMNLEAMARVLERNQPSISIAAGRSVERRYIPLQVRAMVKAMKMTAWGRRLKRPK